MRKFALLGCPLGHSMSPPIHERLFKLSGKRDSEYSLAQISETELDKRIDELMSLDGFNITIPHKVNIIKYTNILSDSAKRYNSVNTVEKKGDKYIGHNTDADGFLRTVKNMGVVLSGNVCVIGAGGVGRMFAIESASNGASITVAVRKSSLIEAQNLCRYIMSEFKTSASAILCDELENTETKFDLMINATPCGMFPNTDSMPVSKKSLSKTSALFDCIYNPTETLLIKTARSMGINTAGGMDMLVWQAVKAHEIWDGAQYSLQEISSLIDEMKLKVDADFPSKCRKEV